ncbi:helix-turn-helix transcriptional regulator [Rubinisphaera margarita]|uniref:helix-turn-helix transcriptional regulator n=1 Tax=Rubinisphaera margarita TaxID=2909586 RepID=UPI001EE9ADE7|nr:winged helix DNA-binding protein [Rubinisphaera margarita]
MLDSIKQSDREFLSHLNELGEATIAQICDAEQVTTNAVRQRLSRLQAAGLIERTAVRHGRGRPQHKYSVTGDGRRLLGDNYYELATVLWRQLTSIPDEQLRSRIADELRRTLVNRYGENVNAADPAERIQQLQQALLKHGFDIQVEQEDDSVCLTEKACPYHDLAVDDRSICDLEQSVFEQILGMPLQLTQRCVDGHSCCRFEPVLLSTDSE